MSQMKSAPIRDRLHELSKELKELQTDKERIKLLLNTINNCNNNVNGIHGEMIAFSVGYMNSLLVPHGLSDFSGFKEPNV